MRDVPHLDLVALRVHGADLALEARPALKVHRRGELAGVIQNRDQPEGADLSLVVHLALRRVVDGAHSLVHVVLLVGELNRPPVPVILATHLAHDAKDLSKVTRVGLFGVLERHVPLLPLRPLHLKVAPIGVPYHAQGPAVAVAQLLSDHARPIVGAPAVGKAGRKLVRGQRVCAFVEFVNPRHAPEARAAAAAAALRAFPF